MCNRISQNNIKQELFEIKSENRRFLIQCYRSSADAVNKNMLMA